MKKNFYHKVGVAEFMAAVIKTPESERGQWVLDLVLDLEEDVQKTARTAFGKDLIGRTKKGRKKASESGKKGAEKRWKKEPENNGLDSDPMGTCSDPIASSRSSSRRSKPIYSEPFLAFWIIYPNKTGKGEAFKAWEKNGCAKLNGEINKAVEQQKTCQQWTKDQGQYIPHPATWLNQRRWEDEPAQHAQSKPSWMQGG